MTVWRISMVVSTNPSRHGLHSSNQILIILCKNIHMTSVASVDAWMLTMVKWHLIVAYIQTWRFSSIALSQWIPSLASRTNPKIKFSFSEIKLDFYIHVGVEPKLSYYRLYVSMAASSYYSNFVQSFHVSRIYSPVLRISLFKVQWIHSCNTRSKWVSVKRVKCLQTLQSLDSFKLIFFSFTLWRFKTNSTLNMII